MKKNEILSGVCTGYNHEGVGVVKVNNFTFFVRETLKDEEISFKVIKLNKKFGYGKLVSIIKPSKHRVLPECKYFGKCGGCQLQHMNMDEQVAFKRQFVEDNIRKIAFNDTKVEDVLSCSFKGAYRNKAQFPIHLSDKVEIGFYRLHSHDIINIDNCMIQSDEINHVIATIRNLLKNDSFSNKLKHILIKHAFHTQEMMVVLISKEKNIPEMNDFIQSLILKEERIKSIILNVNTRNDNVILGDKEYLLYGKDKICEELMNYKFNIASKSFYQVNPYQTEVLYQKVLEYAQIQPTDTVVDLYCGVGSISLFLAKRAKQVIGIEIIEDAIINAKENAKINNIHNIDFICSDAGKYASKIVKDKINIDVVVVDPPRKGCDETTIHNIVVMNPIRVVYVSCNPSTLARDIKLFEELGYHCEMIQPVDMFPHTFHVETVALLSRKSGTPKLKVSMKPESESKYTSEEKSICKNSLE